ncbi:MAG TPA: hypothetical protein VK507_05920, partial [Iamia sp.]|nr:hypothetical protein [Iamia sp.]
VDTLVANYVGALETDGETSNTKIDVVLDRPRPGTSPARHGRPYLRLVARTDVRDPTPAREPNFR